MSRDIFLADDDASTWPSAASLFHSSEETLKQLPKKKEKNFHATLSLSLPELSLSPFGSAFTRPTYRPRAGGFVRTQISAAVAAAAEATHVTGRFRSSTGESRLVPPLKKAGEKILSRPCIGEDDLTAETKKKNTRSADFGTKFLSTTRATKKRI